MFLRFISFISITFFLSQCQYIPFIGHDEVDNSTLNDLLILKITSDTLGGSGSIRNNSGRGGDGARQDCSTSGPNGQLGLSSVTWNDSTFTTGYSQVSANRQNAFAFKHNGTAYDWCYYYDQSPADTRGALININGDGSELFVAFTTDGGNANFRTTEGAVQGSYGQGGGPKVTYLARINPENGDIINATYLGARLGSNGRTNTLDPKSITIGDGIVTFVGRTSADGGNMNDSLQPGFNCSEPPLQSPLKRTVVMPFNLTRQSGIYEATCEGNAAF